MLSIIYLSSAPREKAFRRNTEINHNLVLDEWESYPRLRHNPLTNIFILSFITFIPVYFNSV